MHCAFHVVSDSGFENDPKLKPGAKSHKEDGFAHNGRATGSAGLGGVQNGKADRSETGPFCQEFMHK